MGPSYGKNNLRIIFKDCQHNFDKEFKYFRRRQRKEEFELLEANARNNPAGMWASLKKLNNPPSKSVALEIVREHQSISRDTKEILSCWFQNISLLFSGLQDNPEVAFDKVFYQEVLKKKKEFKRLSHEDQHQTVKGNLEVLTIGISYDEIVEAKDKSKSKKAYLDIPNEALKNKKQMAL